MAVGTPAWAAGSATIPTRVLRHLPATLLGVPVITHSNAATATTRGGGYGVGGGGDLAVTSTGGLGYSVAAGHFALPGTSATGQGTYVSYNDAAVTGTLPARNATNPYIAYIAVQIRDTDEDATGSEDASIVVIQGTAAATPSPPAVPSSLGSLLILSEVLVPSSANGGAVVFTERRAFLNAIGGNARVTSATRPTSSALWDGQHIYETDTKNLLVYNAATPGWKGIRPIYFFGAGGTSGNTTGGINILTTTAPAVPCPGIWVVTATTLVTPSTGGESWELQLNDGTTTYSGYRFKAVYSGEDVSTSQTASFNHTAAGATTSMNVALIRSSGAGNANYYSDARYNRIDAIFIPDA